MHKHSHLSVANDFSKFPAGRFKQHHGDVAGDAFRELLTSKLRQNDSISVSLDGTMGFGSNWLEEAFGGLVSKENFTIEELNKKLTVYAEDKSLVVEVWEYINGSVK